MIGCLTHSGDARAQLSTACAARSTHCGNLIHNIYIYITYICIYIYVYRIVDNYRHKHIIQFLFLTKWTHCKQLVQHLLPLLTQVIFVMKAPTWPVDIEWNKKNLASDHHQTQSTASAGVPSLKSSNPGIPCPTCQILLVVGCLEHQTSTQWYGGSNLRNDKVVPALWIESPSHEWYQISTCITPHLKSLLSCGSYAAGSFAARSEPQIKWFSLNIQRANCHSQAPQH